MLPREFNGIIWRTKDGKYLKTNQIKTEHLKNILLFLKKDETIDNIRNMALFENDISLLSVEYDYDMAVYSNTTYNIFNKLKSISNKVYFETYIKNSNLYKQLEKEYERRLKNEI